MSDYSNVPQSYEGEGDTNYGRTQRVGRNANRPQYRSKTRPAGFNGMHRRRHKRWTW